MLKIAKSLLLLFIFILLQIPVFAQLTLGFNSNGNTAGCAPYTLTFPITNIAGNPANTTYVVNFGDGSPVLNFTQGNIPASVTHTYTTNSCGSAFQTTNNVFGATITASSPTNSPFTAAVSPIVISSPPDAIISPLTSTVCVGSSVSINNNSSQGVYIDPSAGYTCSTTGAISYWTISPAAGWSASAASMGSNNGFPNASDFDVWSQGATPLSVTFNTAGSYRVKIWIANTCGLDTMSVPVCVVPPPNPQFNLNPSFGCIPPNLSVTANNTTAVTPSSCYTPTYSYNWSISPSSNWAFNGASNASSTSPSFSFLSAGTYTVTLTASISALSGCSASINHPVTVNQAPTVNAGLDQSVCVGSPAIQLTGSPTGGTWSGTGVNASGLFTPTTTGNFTLTYTIPASAGTGCPAVTDQVIVSVITPTAANAGADQSLCPGTPAIQLNATPTGGTWTGTGVTSGGVFTPTTPGSYTLTYSFGTGPCAVSDQKVITVYSPPTVSVNSPVVCAGFNATLTAVGAAGLGPYSYAWSPSAGLSSGSGASVTTSPAPLSSTSYTVTVTDAHTCTASAVSNITVNPLPSVNAGSDISVCNNAQVTQLTGTPTGGTWSGTGVTAGGAFTPPGLGNYTLTYSYTNANTCSSSDQIIVSVVNPSPAGAGLDQQICVGATPLQLNGTPAGGTWSGTGVSTSGLFTPTTPGNVTLTYSFGSGTCASTDQMQMTVYAAPTVNVNNPTVCEGTPATLTAVGAGGLGPYSYSWNPSVGLSAAVGASVVANLTTTTSITVTLTDAHTCQATDVALVTVNPVPVVNAGADQTICLNPSTIQMNGTPAGGTWTGDNVTTSGAYTPVAAGTDSLFYTISTSGCTRSDTMVVNVQVPGSLQLTPDTTVCLNSGNFQLYAATPGGNWTSSTATLTSSGIFTPDAVGVFVVSYSVGAGFCAVGGSLQVTVIAPPTVDAGSDVTLCANSPAYTFPGESPTSGGTWSWSGTGITNTTTGVFSPSISGAGVFPITYTFTSTATGCSASDGLQVTVNALPNIVLNPAVLNVCLTPFGSQLTASPAGGFWTGAGLTYGSNVIAPLDTATYTPSSAGSFSVYYTYTDANTCVNRDTVLINVSVPTPANAGSDTAFCFSNLAHQLTGSPAGTWINPSWLNANGTFISDTVGTFNAIYAVGGGSCLVYDTALVTIHPLPVVHAGLDQQLCAADPCFNLAAPSPLGGTWSGPGIANAASGQFCAATANNGVNQILYTYQNPTTTCSNTDTLLVTIVPMPVPGVAINPLFCINTPVQVTNLSSGAAATFEWNVKNTVTGALVQTSSLASPVVNIATAGTYQIEQICYSIYNCETRDTAYFTVVAPPIAAFSLADNIICGPHQETVTNTSSGYQISFLWDFGPSGPGSTDTIPVLPVFAAPIIADSLYHVTLSVSNMCGTRTAVDSVIIRPVPVALIGTDYSQGCSPFSAVIQNVSYGSPDWFMWDLGDGTTSTDSLPPAHTFTTTDTVSFIPITLQIGNTCGNANAATNVIVYPDHINPTAQTPIVGCSPFEVDFNFPLGDLTYYLWDFGDSTGIAGDSVSHIYENAGVYHVMLTVSNFCLVDTILNTVTVYAGPDLDFTIDQPSICQTNQIQISNTSQNSAFVNINFGDGSTSPISSSVNHVYNSTGTQTIQMYGVNPQTGCVDTVSQTVEVVPFPVINVTADPDTGCMPLLVQFFNSSSLATGYEWHFPDGTSSILAEPQIMLAQSGDFQAQLIAHNYQGIGADCPDTAYVTIHVNPSPQSSFILAADSACGPPAQTAVSNTSTGGNSYTWLWESTSSTDFEPQLTFSDTGFHQVRLVAENLFACRDTSASGFMVLGQPQIALSIDPPNGCMPHEVTFDNLSLYGNQVQWAFGDGQFSTLDSVSHVYEEAGLYSIELLVSSGGICSDDTILVEVIEVYPSAFAGFEISPAYIPESLPQINLTNTSALANSFELYVEEELISGNVPPTYLFENPDTGLVQLMLIANNTFNCPDTAYSDVYIKSSPSIYIPSSFTPNEDGLNDGFRPYMDRAPSEYYFAIYDRWGHVVFETNDRDKYWDGTFKNKGKKAIKQDVYVYKLTAIFSEEEVFNLFGNITVIH